MKTIHRSLIQGLFILALTGMHAGFLRAQPVMPAVMDTASLSGQLEYLQERTGVYNGFRAIRDDIFLRLKQNTLDSLQQQKAEVMQLHSELEEREQRIETLTSDLGSVKDERDQAIRTKDSFTLLGLEIQKGVYNAVMWFIILGLAVLSAILFILFKRSHTVTAQTRKELETLREEFEAYRKSSREKYEKLVVSHHNEIMKLKRP